jgi:hypothetical protein
MRKKRFRFEKWWTKKADFQEVVSKAWGGEGGGGVGKSPISEWQDKVRRFRKMARGGQLMLWLLPIDKNRAW